MKKKGDPVAKFVTGYPQTRAPKPKSLTPGTKPSASKTRGGKNTKAIKGF